MPAAAPPAAVPPVAEPLTAGRVSRPWTASATSFISFLRSKVPRRSLSSLRSSLFSNCLRRNVLGLRSSNSKSLNSGPSSLRMSFFALSENSRTFRMKRETSWITFGSLSGPKTSTARTTSVTSSSAPMSLNT